MKKLLVAVGVLMGVTNFAWAGDTYFGSDTKECGAWDASSKSKNYILQKGGTITLNFTFSTNDDSETYRLDTEDVSGEVDIKDKKWKNGLLGLLMPHVTDGNLLLGPIILTVVTGMEA